MADTVAVHVFLLSSLLISSLQLSEQCDYMQKAYNIGNMIILLS